MCNKGSEMTLKLLCMWLYCLCVHTVLHLLTKLKHLMNQWWQIQAAAINLFIILNLRKVKANTWINSIVHFSSVVLWFLWRLLLLSFHCSRGWWHFTTFVWFLFLIKNTQKQMTCTLRRWHRRSKADSGVHTTPSLRLRGREIIRPRLHGVEKGGGEEDNTKRISHVGLFSLVSLWLIDVQICKCARLTTCNWVKQRASETSQGTRTTLFFFSKSHQLNVTLKLKQVNRWKVNRLVFG